MDVRLPAPLRPGDTIAVTAPSSGVPAALQPRLDVAIADLRRRGFEVLEGVCLRDGDTLPVPSHGFTTTGDPEEFRSLARRFLGPEVATVFGNMGEEG